MQTKDQVSNSYMDQMVRKHFQKELLSDSARTALVTGAEKSGSIGEAIVDMLSGRNFRKVRTPHKREYDVRNDEHISKMILNAAESDTLILCHGENHMDWIENQSFTAIQRVIETNLIGTIKTVSAFVDMTLTAPMRKQIVIIGSMAYNHVLNASAPYCASKAGLAHFVRCAGWELAPKGYDVFGVHPSNTEGAPMTEDTIKGIMRYRGVDRHTAENYWGAICPKGRWLTPQDIAQVVSNLLMPSGESMSGTNIELSMGQR